MNITLVVAASENNAIGLNNQLLWHLPKDMRFFKNTTWGLPIVMGRKTFESLGNKVLPGRLNLILSNQKNIKTNGATLVNSLQEAINIAVQQGCQTIFVGVGGTASIDGGAGILETVEKEKLGDVELVAATDVDVLLLGNRGAAKGFGEQKGASKELIEELEKKHEQLAQSTPKRKDNKDASQMLGAGAGGGIGFALMALGANRVSGLELVTESFDLANEITNSDLVITGEGKLDWQTLRGKVITGVAEIANESAISCLALCGQVIAGKRELAAAGIVGAYGCIEEGEELPEDPFMALVFLAERVSRTWSQ